MKINLFFFLARFGYGGAGNSVYRLCKSLDKNKFNVNVIYLNKCAYETNLKKNKVKTYKIDSTRAFFSIFKINKLLNSILNSNQKNIFISNINYTNLLCALFLNKKSITKLIAIERTPLKELEIYFNKIDFLKKKIMSSLTYFCYKKFDKIICNSKYMANYLKKKYNFNSVTIYPPSIKAPKKKFKGKNYKNFKTIQITTVCRLSREKSIQEIIYALNFLKNKKIRLNIIGEGPEKEFLKNLVKKFNLEKNIKFLGHKIDIDKFLIKTDLYINSSFFEGFPNSVVEAANLGVPIIASQSHGGINEILLNGKCGTIYSKGYKNLASKIKKFSKNRKTFINKAKKAKKNILRFSSINHKNHFENILNSI